MSSVDPILRAPAVTFTPILPFFFYAFLSSQEKVSTFIGVHGTSCRGDASPFVRRHRVWYRCLHGTRYFPGPGLRCTSRIPRDPLVRRVHSRVHQVSQGLHGTMRSLRNAD